MHKRFAARSLLISLCLSLVLAGCYPTDTQNELRVAAASSMTEVFQVLAQRFEEAHGVRVIPSFSTTGQLAQQIRNGAPYDIFVSADTFHIDTLIEEGYLDAGSRIVYARGELVVIRPRGSSVNIDSLSQLVSADVDRIAIANPDHAPYGIAAREALTASGIWSEISSKVLYAETVKQAAVIVATGNAEAGIVARSVVTPEVEVIFEIAPEQHAPILHAAASSSHTLKQDVAMTFLHFLLAPAGQAILRAYGFSAP